MSCQVKRHQIFLSCSEKWRNILVYCAGWKNNNKCRVSLPTRNYWLFYGLFSKGNSPFKNVVDPSFHIAVLGESRASFIKYPRLQARTRPWMLNEAFKQTSIIITPPLFGHLMMLPPSFLVLAWKENWVESRASKALKKSWVGFFQQDLLPVHDDDSGLTKMGLEYVKVVAVFDTVVVAAWNW